MLEQRLRHQRAGIEADRAARDQVAAAHRDQVGRARSGADEMHRHRPSPTAMAQVARSVATRVPSRRALRPATTSAEASAIDGTPLASSTSLRRREHLARDAVEIRHRAGDQLDRQAPRGFREGRLGRLLRFGGDRLETFGRQLEHAERQAHRALDLVGRGAAPASHARDDHGLLTRHCMIGAAAARRRHPGAGLARLGLEAHQFAAVTLEALDQPRLGVERDGIGDQPAARLQGRPRRLEHAGIGRVRRR